MTSNDGSTPSAAGAFVPQKEPSQEREFQPLRISSFRLHSSRRSNPFLHRFMVPVHVPNLSCTWHFWVRIAKTREVTRSGLDVQVFEQMIILRKIAEPS